MAEIERIREQVAKIGASGVLGRSRSYTRLLEYLVECTAEERAPKELEIATEVFGRGPDFDPSQDSMVRVYAHNLRQKLGHYYATIGRDEVQQITIPRGEYRVVLEAAQAAAVPEDDVLERPPAWRRLAAAAAVLAAGIVIGLLLAPAERPASSVFSQVAASPVWADMLADDIPILVVVGDYYIFAELDGRGNVSRLVREFSINSARELDDFMMFQSELQARYLDLDLTYLPRASASALRDVLRVLYTTDKSVQVVAMSELNVARLRNNHVLYVGYVSALDKLLDFVFASSGLQIGDTFDELVKPATGQLFASGAGLPGAFRNYRDYGFFSSFPGPSGNRLMVIAGTRDTGLMHTAYALTDPVQITNVERAVGARERDQPLAFELLYEVMGVDRTNLDGTLVHTGQIDYQSIWGGDGVPRR
jgi:hypothetical protein